MKYYKLVNKSLHCAIACKTLISALNNVSTHQLSSGVRAGGRTPRTPRSGGGSRMLRGLMLRMKIFFLVFNVFKIFVKIFVHNDSVVTYLMFESCDIVISQEAYWNG